MLAKSRPAPVVGRPSNSVRSGGIWDASSSPRSGLEFKILSPRGPVNCDLGGVGLGIVVALQKYVEGGPQVPAKNPFFRRNSSLSDPKNSSANRKDIEEDYISVTGRGPRNKKFARVYYDGDSDEGMNQRKDFYSRRSTRSNNSTLFTVSPARVGDLPTCPPSDFLSSCRMCQKKLHGKDIYMYRGEKAFCSPECRYRQIVMDEKKEKCSSVLASRSVEVSGSSSKNGRMFLPRILAI